MAPHSRGIGPSKVMVSILGTRDIPEYSSVGTGFDQSQLHILKSVSLGIGSLSVASGVLVFYWFFRMRRSFRHDLIMLLISSDMLKALWFMIYPIVELINGPIQSQSAFCQASGFFLTVGIEASDIAVFLIALHTALYIFKPQQIGGQNGLYPYRRTAYTVFAIFPLTMASLAFVDSPGYASNGEYCYLPVHLVWKELVLSWVPRYVILLTIITLYGLIYLYVTLLMRRFGRVNTMRRSGAMPALGGDGRQSGSSDTASTLPILPSMAHRGFLDSASTSRRGSAASVPDRERQQSVSTVSTLKADGELSPKPHASRSPFHSDGQRRVQWKWAGFGSDIGDNAATHSTAQGFHAGPDSPNSPPSPRSSLIAWPQPTHFGHDRTAGVERTSCSDVASTRKNSTLSILWNPALESRAGSASSAPSLPNIFSVLRRSSSTPSDATTRSSLLLSRSAVDVTGMAKTRDKIRRQLRLLFVYPLVYILIWIIPFVLHILKWDDPRRPGPFPVVFLALFSLCVQGTVNSWLFATREKPWRHTRSSASRPSIWKQLARCFGLRKRGARKGRTREEMLVDGRIARTRRDEEIAERRMRMEQPRISRHWWDRMDDDGMMEDSDRVL